MPKIIIREMQVKGAGGGYRKQLARIKQVDYHGKRIFRDVLIPIEPGEEPYAIGVYELSERSYYVERATQQLKLIPRLKWLRALDAIQAQSDDQDAQPLEATA